MGVSIVWKQTPLICAGFVSLSCSRAGRTPLNLKKSAGNPNLAYTVKDNLLFKADDSNLAYEVSATQMADG